MITLSLVLLLPSSKDIEVIRTVFNFFFMKDILNVKNTDKKHLSNIQPNTLISNKKKHLSDIQPDISKSKQKHLSNIQPNISKSKKASK